MIEELTSQKYFIIIMKVNVFVWLVIYFFNFNLQQSSFFFSIVHVNSVAVMVVCKRTSK